MNEWITWDEWMNESRGMDLHTSSMSIEQFSVEKKRYFPGTSEDFINWPHIHLVMTPPLLSLNEDQDVLVILK